MVMEAWVKAQTLICMRNNATSATSILAKCKSATRSSRCGKSIGDLTGDGVVDGVIMVEMVNLLPVNGYQFNFSLTPGIVDVVSALDEFCNDRWPAGLTAQMGPNTVIILI